MSDRFTQTRAEVTAWFFEDYLPRWVSASSGATDESPESALHRRSREIPSCFVHFRPHERSPRRRCAGPRRTRSTRWRVPRTRSGQRGIRAPRDLHVQSNQPDHDWRSAIPRTGLSAAVFRTVLASLCSRLGRSWLCTSLAKPRFGHQSTRRLLPLGKTGYRHRRRQRTRVGRSRRPQRAIGAVNCSTQPQPTRCWLRLVTAGVPV
jgi:hypothetical protein